MEDLEFLNRVDVLQGLSVSEIVKLRGCCQPGKAEKEQRLCVEGQQADEFFLLVEGQVELRYELPRGESSSDQTLSVVEPGGSWGWSAMVPPHRYTLSGYCTSPLCRYVRLGRDDLLDLFDQNHHIGYIFMRNLASVIGKRFHAAQDELARIQGFDQVHRW
ncbi:MAG: cyclic nucleotide-binding domain-containing protein [Deltaproteobacteria bacterium]|nr:cyclic nucleotide-binding domain-containing protein [Deltaproteobacteria bacterium]